MNPFTLTGKNIIITGASSGIGRQCAISCAAMGATVVLIARNQERLKETLSQMANKDTHLCYSVDLTDYNSVIGIIRDAVSKIGRLTGLLNCAGISTTLAMKMTSPETLEMFFYTNVFSAYFLTKEVCKVENISKEGASVIFISSVMASVGTSGKSIYSMTKGALLSGSRSLACELAKKNIRVNVVSPGAILTPINENLPHMKDPELRKALEEQHLLGLGRTEDVANACIFLLSDASRWVTGTNLIVDGGYTAR